LAEVSSRRATPHRTSRRLSMPTRTPPATIGRVVALREQLKERAGVSALELRRELRDVTDHATRVLERTEGF
jgi:hypothetical protein